jgi:hypothetical protein
MRSYVPACACTPARPPPPPLQSSAHLSAWYATGQQRALFTAGLVHSAAVHQQSLAPTHTHTHLHPPPPPPQPPAGRPATTCTPPPPFARSNSIDSTPEVCGVHQASSASRCNQQLCISVHPHFLQQHYVFLAACQVVRQVPATASAAPCSNDHTLVQP